MQKNDTSPLSHLSIKINYQSIKYLNGRTEAKRLLEKKKDGKQLIILEWNDFLDQTTRAK